MAYLYANYLTYRVFFISTGFTSKIYGFWQKQANISEVVKYKFKESSAITKHQSLKVFGQFRNVPVSLLDLMVLLPCIHDFWDLQKKKQ